MSSGPSPSRLPRRRGRRGCAFLLLQGPTPLQLPAAVQLPAPLVALQRAAERAPRRGRPPRNPPPPRVPGAQAQAARGLPRGSRRCAQQCRLAPFPPLADPGTQHWSPVTPSGRLLFLSLVEESQESPAPRPDCGIHPFWCALGCGAGNTEEGRQLASASPSRGCGPVCPGVRGHLCAGGAGAPGEGPFNVRKCVRGLHSDSHAHLASHCNAGSGLLWCTN